MIDVFFTFNPFKVDGTIIMLVFIYMVHFLFIIISIYKCQSNKPMNVTLNLQSI